MQLQVNSIMKKGLFQLDMLTGMLDLRKCSLCLRGVFKCLTLQPVHVVGDYYKLACNYINNNI